MTLSSSTLETVPLASPSALTTEWRKARIQVSGKSPVVSGDAMWAKAPGILGQQMSTISMQVLFSFLLTSTTLPAMGYSWIYHPTAGVAVAMQTSTTAWRSIAAWESGSPMMSSHSLWIAVDAHWNVIVAVRGIKLPSGISIALSCFIPPSVCDLALQLATAGLSVCRIHQIAVWTEAEHWDVFITYTPSLI